MTDGRVRLLRRHDVRAALDMASCIDACERAFAAYSTGAAELPGVIHLEVPEHEGEIHVKAGHLHGGARYSVKVASGFYEQDPAAIDGLVLVYDARDGRLEAILLDGGELTDVRTGAAGGVAAKWLAPAEVTKVAVVGTGIQARRQVEALLAVRPGLREIRVWGRNPAHADQAVADLSALVGTSRTCSRADSADEAVHGAGVVVTCTGSREPLVMADWLAPGTHVSAVGADGAGKQELDPEILRRADVLAVDSREQCASLGELQHAPDQAARAVELGEICARDAPCRTTADQLTVCDLTGLGAQDVAAAALVVERAGDRGETI